MDHLKCVTTSTEGCLAVWVSVLLALLLTATSVAGAENAGQAPELDAAGGRISQSVEGTPAAGASWVESGAGVDLGVVTFGLRGERREWNLGIGHALGVPIENRWSFIGGGLAVTRPRRDDPLAPLGGDGLDGTEVSPWVGGCVNCNLGEGVRLGFELKWAPDSAVLLDDKDTGSEGRAGVSLGVQW